MLTNERTAFQRNNVTILTRMKKKLSYPNNFRKQYLDWILYGYNKDKRSTHKYYDIDRKSVFLQEYGSAILKIVHLHTRIEQITANYLTTRERCHKYEKGQDQMYRTKIR